MRLFLCRHAEAVDHAGVPSIDADRWLTVHGQEQARAVGKALRHEGFVLDALFTSPLVRAVQTAAGLTSGLHFDAENAAMRSLAPGGELEEVLAQLEELTPEATSVAIVGHEPQMSEWSARLLGRDGLAHAFKKGAVLCIEWEGRPKIGHGRGVFYMTPKTLRREPV